MHDHFSQHQFLKVISNRLYKNMQQTFSFTPLMFILLTLFLLTSCVSSSSVTQLKSNNSSFRIKSLVMHFTAVNYEESLKFLVDEGGGVSSHYLIPQLNDATYPQNKLEILQLVDETERAWHAGVSYWQGRTGLNDSSIGIEIVNMPECIESEVPAGFIKPKAMCVYPEFESKQIDLLIKLSLDILKRNPDISPTAVIGHSDIAPSRKNDPGPRFPWQQLYEAGIGAWYDTDTLAKYWNMFNSKMPTIGLVQRALNTYGYGINQTGVLDRQTQDVLGAFQMHFLPWQVNYQSDSNTAATIFALIEKYFPERLSQLMQMYEAQSQNDDQSINTLNQLNLVFTPLPISELIYSHNRASFVALKNKGTINISASGIRSADIYINEQKLNLGEYFSDSQAMPLKQETGLIEEAQSKKAQSFSIARRTQHGLNSIRVDNIIPIQDSRPKLLGSTDEQKPAIEISIPYPQLTTASELEKNSYDFSQLDTLIAEDVENGFPGASILVVHQGKIIKQSAYGYARKYADGGELMSSFTPMTTNTMFDLASNTKVFGTTLALMKLVEEGQLDLNTPLANYLAEYNGIDRGTRTIADLLSHASGYSSEIQFFKRDNPFGEALFSQDKTLTTELLLNHVPFANGRRSQQTYSDTNFMILGLLVERVSGMSLDEYLHTHIYQALQLANTSFTPLLKGRQPDEFAATEINGNTRGGRVDFENVRQYVLQGEVHDEKAYYSMQGVSGHAGLFSNTYDLAVLSQLLLNGGGYGSQTLFSEKTIRRFVHPEFVTDSKGLGWRLASDETRWHFGPYASSHAFGHTGWTGTATLIDPELDLAIIYLTNRKHSPIVGDDQSFEFIGDSYSCARYANIMSLVYEAILEQTAGKKH